jgi:hypothetical protein
VSEEEPFVLSSFSLNADGSGWTLNHRVALSPLWADGGFPWLPLQGETRPKIGVLDLARDDVVYLTVGQHMVVVDIQRGRLSSIVRLKAATSAFYHVCLPRGFQDLRYLRQVHSIARLIVCLQGFVHHNVTMVPIEVFLA